MNIKESIRPTRKDLVIDTVEAAGIDVAKWRESGNNANPAYCYNWAFADPKQGIVLLFLWFDEIVERDGELLEEGNLRGLIRELEATSSPKSRRARKLDEALMDAWNGKWSIRVGIVLEKDRRGTAREDRDTNHADFRELDPVPWRIASYDHMSGDYLLMRGAVAGIPAEAGETGVTADVPEVDRSEEGEGYIDGADHGTATVGEADVLIAAAGDTSAASADTLDAGLVSDLDQLASRGDVSPTTRAALVDARLGQGSFRRALIARWSGRCAVSGCDQLAVLRASHIKPWRASTDGERLDPENGLLLAANLDALFDAGLIAFEDDGQMRVSVSLTLAQQDALGVPAPMRAVPTARQREYLAGHRAWARDRLGRSDVAMTTGEGTDESVGGRRGNVGAS